MSEVEGMLAAYGDSNAGFLIVVLMLYFVPTVIAFIRKVPNAGSVVVINLFLGWTLIGWVLALAMAARSVPVRPSPPVIPPRQDGIPPPP